MKFEIQKSNKFVLISENVPEAELLKKWRAVPISSNIEEYPKEIDNRIDGNITLTFTINPKK